MWGGKRWQLGKKNPEAEQMNTIKYELYGFSVLVSMTVVLLAMPGSQEERRSIAETGRTTLSQEVFGARN